MAFPRLKPAEASRPPAPDHDHSHCAHDPARAGEGRGVDLTASRRRILDELCRAGRPVGAYEMIDRLAASTGKRPAPISIYRALDFLVDNGLVHRLASRNSFFACAHGHDRREPVIFLICDDCGAVSEVTSDPVRDDLASVAKTAGFSSRASVIELAGRCGRCRAA
jgi:Fur family zinc uptake transcriptional regulator